MHPILKQRIRTVKHVYLVALPIYYLSNDDFIITVRTA